MKKHLGIIKYFVAMLLSSVGAASFAQTPTDTLPGDPGGIYAYTIQNICLGAFAHGLTGGTLTVGSDGTRTSTGDVVPLNLGVQYYNAIFEIEAPPGAIISILNGPDATLSGSNGGSMTLHIGNSSPASPFNNVIPPPGRTQISIGGTLTVGGSGTAPPGSYTGTIYVTFNHE
jgi:hypothetical protein